MRLFSRRKNKDNNKNKNKNRSYQKAKHSHVRNIMSNIEKEGKKILDAATDNKLDVIKEMLNNNPSLINVAYSQGGYAILHIAAYKGYTDMIKYVFEFDKTDKKLNVNIKDKEGMTPLLYSIIISLLSIPLLIGTYNVSISRVITLFVNSFLSIVIGLDDPL